MATQIINEAISQLQARRLALALGSLEQPSNRTEFGYGVACGLCQGLNEALQIIEDLLAQDEQAEAEQ